MLTIISSFGLLIVEVWILATIALGLHYFSKRYGVSLLLMYTAAIVGILTYADPLLIFVEPLPGILLTIPADIFIPVILVVVLVLYITDGTEIALVVIYGIALIQLLIALTFVIISFSAQLPNATIHVDNYVFTDLLVVNLQDMVSGVIAFVVDMFVVAIIYQGVYNVFNRRVRWLAIGAALLGALWTDAIVFQFLSTLGKGTFAAFAPGDIVSKTVTALALFPFVAVYLNRIAPRLSIHRENNKRPTFDILHNIFGNWRLQIIQLESELRESDIHTHQLIRNINEIFWIAQKNDDYAHFISPAFEEITGIPRGEYYLNSDVINELIHPDDAEQIKGKWLTYADSDGEIEFRIIRRDRAIRWLRNRTYFVHNRDLNIDRVIGIVEDVTAQKEHEALQQSIELEREKLKFLQQLVREISHDIQSPIAAISLKVQLLERVRDEPKRQKKYLKELQKQTQHLEQIIKQLFTLIKVRSQSNELVEVCNLNEICKDVFDELEPIASEKELSIDLVLCDKPIPVQCQSTNLRRAITNLVSNAIRYTKDKGTITVQTNIKADKVKVIIVDTGIGIRQEDLPKIFDRFYRADNTEKIEGTGLGLAITKEVVEQHKGTVQVESELNIGTTFSITLPLHHI